MHLKTREIAFLGMLLALCQILLVLAGTFSYSSLSLTVLSALTVGVAILISGPGGATAFFAAAMILGWFLAPDRTHLWLFAAVGAYQLFLETLQPKLLMKCPIWLVWVIKLGLFNLIFLPLLLIVPQLFIEESPAFMTVVFAVLANVVMVLFDSLYFRLKFRYGPRIRAWIGGNKNGKR